MCFSDLKIWAVSRFSAHYGKKGKGDGSEIKIPDFFVFPVDIVKQAQVPDNDWGMVKLSAINDIDSYKDAWSLIYDFLNK